MPHYRYLIVGGGMAGDTAARGIREVDPIGTIGLISAEPYPPYNRPPLSKGLWKGQTLEDIWRDTRSLGVELHLGRIATSLDPGKREVIDNQGTLYTFEKLLLATGGTPRKLPSGTGAEDRVVYFRTYDDYQRVRTMAAAGERFAVIGGGFIGSEMAAALTMNGKRVVMILMEEGVCGRLFPSGLARFVTEYYQERGVEVITEDAVMTVEGCGEKTVLQTKAGRRIEVDGVVAGLGIRPNTDLAEQAGLPVDDGIAVDEYLQPGHPDIYAAGDVVKFYNPLLGKRIRVEHEDNANTMGQVAGRNMAGEATPYHHLPFFYSDLFDLGYEAVGELDPQLETVEDWKEPYREGVVYYLEGGRVRGVLLWNVWGQLDRARELIAQPGPFTPAELKGRIPA
ncbi:MAG: FAD-dependent oxidoreductase [Armatimonadota bacterium]|nr:FAD-dependent oxidoreductase [Armatimonadota bacterium]